MVQFTNFGFLDASPHRKKKASKDFPQIHDRRLAPDSQQEVPIGAMPVHGKMEFGQHFTDVRFALRDSGEQDDLGVQCLERS